VVETDGAKILSGPGARTLSLRDEEILINRARGVPTAELAKKHGIMTRHDVANMKTLGELYDRMVRSAVELSGQMPSRLGDRFAMAIMGKHRDPKTPEELAAEEVEQETAKAERDAKVEARMRRQYPFLFQPDAELTKRGDLFDAQYEAEVAALRADGMSATAEERAAELQQLEAMGLHLLDGRDLARLEYLQGRFDADEDDYQELVRPELQAIDEPEPDLSQSR
jgi:hypothetical protein